MLNLSVEVRAANKKAQTARVAAKGTPEYPVIYAQQPEQVRLAAEHRAARVAERQAKAAIAAAAIAAGDEAAGLWSGGNMATVGAVE